MIVLPGTPSKRGSSGGGREWSGLGECRLGVTRVPDPHAGPEVGPGGVRRVADGTPTVVPDLAPVEVWVATLVPGAVRVVTVDVVTVRIEVSEVHPRPVSPDGDEGVEEGPHPSPPTLRVPGRQQGRPSQVSRLRYHRRKRMDRTRSEVTHGWYTTRDAIRPLLLP